MTKLMAIGAMMVAAVPSFAANAAGGDVDIDFRDASQTQAATQTNRGDADAGNLGSAADIDQDLDQSQVNGGFGGVAADDDIRWWDWR